MNATDLTKLLYKRLIIRGNIKKNGRVASNLFMVPGKLPDCQISVDLASMTNPSEAVNRTKRTDLALGEFDLDCPISLNFELRHDPDFEVTPHNLAHHLLLGNNNDEKCRKLADSVRIIPGVVSDGVTDEDYEFAFRIYDLKRG